MVGHLCATGRCPPSSTPKTSVVVLWLPSRCRCTNPWKYSEPRRCGLDPISKLLTTKLKCVASTECPNNAHSCQRRIEGNSDPNQQFAFGRSEDTRGQVPPEAGRSAVESDSLICSIRQATSRPQTSHAMGHSAKTRLAVKARSRSPRLQPVGIELLQPLNGLQLPVSG